MAEPGVLAPFAWSRVLVVDDTEANAALVRKALLRGGLNHVDELHDGRSALERIALEDPDVVLLDLHMPQPDGFEVLARIRDKASSTELPVIVLTADGTREACDRALAAGANDFLPKPLNAGELLYRVRNMLEMRGGYRALHQRQRWLEAAEEFTQQVFAGVLEEPVAGLAATACRLAGARTVSTTPPPAVLVDYPSRVAAKGSWNAEGRRTADAVEFSPRIHEYVAAQGSPLLLTDDGESGPVGTAMVLPINGTGGPRGTLCLVRDRHDLPFTETDLENANLFVSRAATALELIDRREERRRYLDFFEILVSQVTDYAILGLDPEGNIASWNDGAERVHGFGAEEVLGRQFSVLYPEQLTGTGRPLRMLDRVRATGRAEYECWGVRSTGERFWAQVCVTALHNDGGDAVGYAAVSRDMTEAHRLEAERESFFASISHDIRGPLGAIQGFAEMIPEAEPENRDEFVRRLQSNVTRLSVMVDNMLDHAQLRAGALQLTLEPLPLLAAAEACVRDLAPILSTHEVTVGGTEAVVFADQLALGRVLANVLINAAKYSPPRSAIEVTVTATEMDGRIEISDHGRGIAQDDLLSVFEEYNRGSNVTADGGTGLGLSSVRELISLHNGRISMSSRPNVGTTVTIDLPLAD